MLEGRVIHLRGARRFAETFMSTIKGWSSRNPKPTIAAHMHVGVDQPLTVFVFTLGRPDAVSFGDPAGVKQHIARAIEIAPTCEPAKGDLAVFDGLRILMFRRFDERLSKRAAVMAAKEVAAHILMDRRLAIDTVYPAAKTAQTHKEPTVPFRDHILGLTNGKCVMCGESNHRIQSHPDMRCKTAEPGPRPWA